MTTPILLSALAGLIPWQSIELNQKLMLDVPIQLSEQLTLKQNAKLIVTDLMPLDQINVMSFKMKITPCSSTLKTQTSDMVIVKDLYGFQLEKECELNVFLEFRDLQNPSLFHTLEK